MKRQLRCGKCKEIGHNTRSCPDRVERTDIPLIDRAFMASVVDLQNVSVISTRITKENDEIKRIYEVCVNVGDLKKEYPILDRDDVIINLAYE